MSTISTSNSVTSGTNAFTALNQATAAASTASKLQSQFLQLLTTQMENQDPTNPADSNQMTSQLAQISMVSGIQDLNTSMGTMSSTFNAAQSFQAANLIGKQVLASGDAMVYDGKDPVQAQVSVPQDAGDVAVSIYNASGAIVDTIQLGKAAAGNTMVTWDGKDLNGQAMPSGNYTVVAQAANGNSTQQLATSTFVGVTSVNLSSTGISLHTTGGTDIAMTDISQIE